jgi:hypothetical protein
MKIPTYLPYFFGGRNLKQTYIFFLAQSSNGQLKKFLFLVTAAILNGERSC